MSPKITAPRRTGRPWPDRSRVLPEILRKPKDNEVNNRIGEKTGQNQRVALSLGDHALPIGSGSFRHGCRLDIRHLTSPEPAVSGWNVVQDKPRYQPEEAKSTGSDKCGTPTISEGQPGDHRRRDCRTNGRACIKNSDAQGSLAGRKPLGDRLCRGWPVPGSASPSRNRNAPRDHFPPAKA